ncbi:MAG: hypothetical protein K9L68_13860 [Spirochaetales bacterium]|nr:hypothetical protein [Spirochaetales bacterium]
MSDTLVQDPQVNGDDSVQETANPSVADEQQGAAPKKTVKDDSQSDQGEVSKELPKFHYQFSKELQGHEALKEMQRPDDLANAYIQLNEKVQKLEGEGSGENVSAESVEDYDLSGVEYPEDMVTDDDISSIKELALNLGLSKTQASKLFESVVKDAKTAIDNNKAQQEEEQKQNEATLKKEFGDSFQEKITEAHRAYEKLGSKELGDLLDSYGLGTNPVVVKAFLNMHEQIGEDSLIEGAGEGSNRNVEQEWFPNSSKAW